MRTKTFRRRSIWSNNTRWRHWWSGVNTGPNYLNRRSHCCECVERWTKYIRNEFVCSTAQLSRIFWFELVFSITEIATPNHNKANLRDLIAATGLVIFLKFDPNHRFFRPCDFEIWWMTLENNRAPLLYFIKLCVAFPIHRWIETAVTTGNTQFGSKSAIFCHVWPWNLMGDLGK